MGLGCSITMYLIYDVTIQLQTIPNVNGKAGVVHVKLGEVD